MPDLQLWLHAGAATRASPCWAPAFLAGGLDGSKSRLRKCCKGEESGRALLGPQNLPAGVPEAVATAAALASRSSGLNTFNGGANCWWVLLEAP